MADRKKYTTVGGVPAPEGSDLRRMIDANPDANEEARVALGLNVLATATAARDASAAADADEARRATGYARGLEATYSKPAKRRAQVAPVSAELFARAESAGPVALELRFQLESGAVGQLLLPRASARALAALLARVGIALALVLSAATASADGVDEQRGKAARAAERKADSCMLHTDSLVCGMKAFCQEHPSALRCNVRPTLPASTFRVVN